MAYRLIPFYNLDAPVGPGKPNKPDDVLLIQALMIELVRFDARDWVAELPAETNLGTSRVFDAKLATWILTVQKWSAKAYAGNAIATDGIIHPMPMANIADASTTFKSGRISTLGMLCNRLWRFDRRAYMTLGDDYNIPWKPELWK